MVSLYKLYDSCERLTVDRFEACLFNGDLKKLQIDESEYVPDAVLKQTWEKIKNDYADAGGGEDFQEYVTLLNKEMRLSVRIEVVSNTIDLMLVALTEPNNPKAGRAYEPIFIDYLRQIGFTEELGYKFNPDNPAEYERDLRKVKTRLGTDEIHLIQAREALKKFEDKSGKAKMKRDYFDTHITALEAHYKFDMPKETLTVSKFCARLKALIAHHKPRD